MRTERTQPPKFDTAAVKRCDEKSPRGPWMIGYSIPSLFETRVLFHAEFCFAMVNAEADLSAPSCLDFQNDFNHHRHAQGKTCHAQHHTDRGFVFSKYIAEDFGGGIGNFWMIEEVSFRCEIDA